MLTGPNSLSAKYWKPNLDDQDVTMLHRVENRRTEFLRTTAHKSVVSRGSALGLMPDWEWIVVGDAFRLPSRNITVAYERS
jgi:hypothetical protein